MKTIKNKIIPNLWFDRQAEEAVKFYTSVFKNSRIGMVYHGRSLPQAWVRCCKIMIKRRWNALPMRS